VEEQPVFRFPRLPLTLPARAVAAGLGAVLGPSAGLFLAGVFLAGLARAAGPTNLPPEVAALPAYTRAAGEVAGSLTCVGSDTMNNLVALWAEGFKRFYPNVREGIEGKGSASAPPALMEGTCSFGPMSRDWKPAEIDAFQERYGYPPTILPVAIDMLVIFVHRDNPLESLSLEQIDAIFSKNRKGGLRDDIRTWGDLGLAGEWRSRPISLYGRNASSGTYGFFKEVALFKGDFKPTVKEQPGSSAVVQAIASDRFGIGYSGAGYRTADVRAVPIRLRGPGLVPAEPLRAYTGEYPLTRFLLLSVNHRPGTRLDPLRREFVRYVLSGSGQAAVSKDGYLPITPALARRSLVAAGLEESSAAAP
jgi:phosphate transport system substrate-binding protein